MDPDTKLKIEKTVVGILETADMADMTEYKVRKEAGQKLNINLSETRYKKFVRNIVENFLKSRQDEEEKEQATEEAEQKVEAEVEAETEEEEEEESPVKKQKKNKKMKIEASKKASQAGELQEATIDDNGDVIICKCATKLFVSPFYWSPVLLPLPAITPLQLLTDLICNNKLNSRRNVSVQEFKGNKLVSIREYYEKDGKQLPTSKGISLTIDQWKAFKKGVPAIVEAIQQLQ